MYLWLLFLILAGFVEKTEDDFQVEKEINSGLLVQIN